MPTLVFGDDRSPGADVAWLWINDQRWSGWGVDVLEIPDASFAPGDRPEAVERRVWTPETPRSVFPQAGIGRLRFLTADADPRVVLGGCTDADLLVVGPTGRGFLKRWLHLGSTTEWLLHEPPAPMCVARSAGPVRNALVAVDGSGPAVRAVEALASLPWAGDVDVHVLGVYDGWAEPAEGIEMAVVVLEQAGIRHTTDQVRGRATESVLQCLEQRRPQLIALGARGHTSFPRVVAGSTASAVSRSAACNVLVTS